MVNEKRSCFVLKKEFTRSYAGNRGKLSTSLFKTEVLIIRYTVEDANQTELVDEQHNDIRVGAKIDV